MCRACALVQLGPSEHPDPEPPKSVESATALAHAALSAAEIVTTEGLGPGASVIEIDSHHGGSWLGGFLAAGLVERSADETADLVADVHGIAHEPDLDGPLAAHGRRVAPGGRVALEFHHLLPMVEQSQIDTVRHGHWVYLSLTALARLLPRHGLVPVRATPVDVFGGSLRLTAARAVDDPDVDPSVAAVLEAEKRAGLDGLEALIKFGQAGLRTARAFSDHLREARAQGRTVAAYLAPAKHGCRLPGTHVPILAPEELSIRQPDEVVILTWDIADEIVDQLARTMSNGGWRPRLFVPLPTPRYMG
jgi:hypothetical protein